MKELFWAMLLLLLFAGCSDDFAGAGDGIDADADGDTDSNGNGSGDADGDADSNGSGYDNGSGGQCADINWNVDLKTINMLVLLDRSGSMADNKIGNDTYAQVVQQAIDQVVQSNTDAGAINFALNVFPSPANCDAAYETDTPDSQKDPAIMCEAASNYVEGADPGTIDAPMVEFSPDVTVDTYNAITDVLDKVGQCGGTPICSSLKWADWYLKSAGMPKGDTYVLLATDGAPNCNPNGKTGSCEASVPGQPIQSPLQCLDDICSYNAALNLARDGYEVFVIGVGEDVQQFAKVMDGIAYFGSEENPASEVPPSDTPYFYPATDATALNSALEGITNQVITCEYEVDWSTVPETNEETGQPVSKTCADVNLAAIKAGETTPSIKVGYIEDCSKLKDGQYGWYWAETPNVPFEEIKQLGKDYAKCGHIRLCPKTCDNLKTVDGERSWDGVSASFGCESVVINILI